MNALKTNLTQKLRNAWLLSSAGMGLFATPLSAVQNGSDVVDAAAGSKISSTITVIGGDGQKGAPGVFNAKPFDIAVWNATGTAPLVDTEVTFIVQSGGGLLAASVDAVLPSSTVTLKTDQDGTVQAYYRQPLVPGLLSQIKASTADGEILLQTTALAISELVEANTKGAGSGSSDAKSSASTGKSGSCAVITFVGGGTTATAKSSATKAKTAALSSAAPQIVLKTPGRKYAVNVSTWAISPYGTQ